MIINMTKIETAALRCVKPFREVMENPRTKALAKLYIDGMFASKFGNKNLTKAQKAEVDQMYEEVGIE